MWKPGDRLTHCYNPEIGPGRVRAVEGRTLVVDFPRTGVSLRLASQDEGLRPFDLAPGRRVRLGLAGEEALVAALLAHGVRLADGREVAADDLWPVDPETDLPERLAKGEVDPLEDFALRFDALRLATFREADGLGSFLGGRIHLFPHQLYAAERAASTDPVRWLLADEVGLGKTIEACLILSHLVRAGRASRCLVVAPETLTVQWLGELWRKYHQVFVLLDEARLADVARDHGADANPFEVHPLAVVALETLIARPRLAAQAVEAAPHLLVVDEAHRLRRRSGHPGNAAWRAVAPIAALGRHLLLLTAIPLDDDVHGFFRLLQLLRPADFPEEQDFESRLARGTPLPPCTSATRRADIGGLPPRVGQAVDLSREDWAARDALVEAVRVSPSPNAPGRRQKADRLRRALASGAALAARLAPGDDDLRARAGPADADDPRLAWLASQARTWKQRGEKTLLFVAHRETLELVRTELGRRAQTATGVFHEELGAVRRDIEVAQFRSREGPSLLVSTECGGEGRNFEFCRRIVLFDLPFNPLTVEQRIGRLDRIGRRGPVEIVYFRPAVGIGAEVVRLFEGLGVFRQPLAGLEPELARVEPALELAALAPSGSLSTARFNALVSGAREAQTRILEAAHRELHRDPYRTEMGPGILNRIPAELDTLLEEVVVAASERLGLRVEPHEDRRYSVELGHEAVVDSLPGVPGGSSFLGTFDRADAVADERLDFFASGHPLVEGILTHLDESSLGRVGVVRVAMERESGIGLLALYRDGRGVEVVALDPSGRARADWAAALRSRPLRTRRTGLDPARESGWEANIRRLASALPPGRRPVALAALVVGP